MNIIPNTIRFVNSLQKIFNGLGFKGIDTIILGSCIGKLDYDMEVCYYEMDCIVNDKNKYKITKELLADYNDIENIKCGDKLIIPTNEK